jgi:hypothetical protein
MRNTSNCAYTYGMAVSEERRRWLGKELERMEAEHRASEGNQVMARISAFQNSYTMHLKRREDRGGGPR